MSKIKTIRLTRGMSRAELSRRSGIPIRTLESWDAQVRKPSDLARMKEIAQILDCSIEDLI